MVLPPALGNAHSCRLVTRPTPGDMQRSPAESGRTERDHVA